MKSWLFVFLLGLLVTVGYSVECPSYCQCYQQSDINSIFSINSIFCINVNRQYIPNYFDFDVKMFNFSGNSLASLAPLAFQNQHYKSLEILDLRRNGITKIDDKAFHRLKNLLEIDLSNNLIHFINRKMFDNNRFLNTIILSGNPITQIKDYSFPPSIYLRRLDFQGCRIEKVHKLAFVNSPLVEYLNLKDNNLKSLSVNVLHYTTQLKSLLLDGNPWRCNRKLWLVLKWLHDRNLGKDSLSCVYGETENAVLWDTMELNHPNKFEQFSDNHARKVEWAPVSKRSRRSSVDEAEKWKPESKSGYNDFDYPKEDNPSESDDSRNQEEFKSKHQQTTSKHPKTNNPRTFRYSDTAEGFKKFGMQSVNSGESPDDSDSNYNQQFHRESSTETFRRYPPNYQRRKQEDLVTKFIPLEKFRMNNDLIHISQVSGDNVENVNLNASYNVGESDDRTNNVKSDYPVENANLEETEPREESVNMNIMLMLIAIEFTLLLVLLYILYKLWMWNQGGSEHGANTPLNSNSKNVKTYNTGSPGYMRYSLSDDDPSIRNKTPEDGKYDSESGYLSYHRYNSVEGENNNDFMFYRHYPHDENTANTDASKNSVFERRPREEVHDEGGRSIRRHSSIRSIGRSAKVNTFTRSVSADKAEQYCSLMGADGADQHRPLSTARIDRHCSTSTDDTRRYFSTVNGSNQFCSTANQNGLVGTDI